MSLRFAILALPIALAACGGGPATTVTLPDAAIRAASFRAPGPPSITLVTSINSENGNGAHSALVINASERVIFDPAGSFAAANIVESDDVVYGVTDPVLEAYLGFQSAERFRVVQQRLVVTPEMAERALRIVKGYGPVSRSYCTKATTDVLQQLGYSSVGSAWFPTSAMQDVAQIPGVVTTEIDNIRDPRASAQ